MVSEIEKYFLKLAINERIKIQQIIERISLGDFAGLNILKLKDSDNMYRTRVGKHRIIFCKAQPENIILWVGKRDEHTYSILRAVKK